MREATLSIRNILLLTISVLTLLISLLASREVYFELKRLSKIEALKKSTSLSEKFFDVIEDLSLERDIAYSMLKAPDADTVNDFRSRLKENRDKVDEGIKLMLHSLKQYDFPGSSEYTGKSEAKFLELQDLRTQIDKVLALPEQIKNNELADHWFNKSTSMITETQDLWMESTKHFSNIDPIVTQRNMFKHFLGIIMEYAGRERTLIGGLIIANAPIKPEEQIQLLRWQGIVDQDWEISEKLADHAQLTPLITPYINDARSHYFTLYDMVKNIFYIPGAPPVSSYPIGIDLWLELASQTTDSLYELKDAASKETRKYEDLLEKKSQRSIIINLAILFSALGLCFYSLWVITRRVINPINNMVRALLRATKGETVEFQPAYLKRDDEIGKLAHVLGAFQENVEKIKRTSLMLEDSENKLQAVVDNVKKRLITIDEHGNIESFNPACERIFGYKANEMIGENIKILIPESNDGKQNNYLSDYIETGSASGIIETAGHEINGKHKNGTTFPMDLSLSSFLLEGERHFSGVIRDITERKEAEKTHEQLRQVQKIEALGQLTGGIAHDFNNLLSIIIGNLDFLVEKIPEDDPLRAFINPSIEAAEYGAELTKSLLAFGRKQTLQPKIISINELIENFISLAKRTLGERIETITSLTPNIWNVYIDAGLFQNALLNLSVNARDAMPKGGKLIYETQNVHFDEEYARDNPEVVPGDYVMVAVSDTGTGMDTQTLEKAFEPFFTTKGVGKGTGLGLSMVYGFVKQSTGHIKIYSEVGQGTSIKIYLPRTQNNLPSNDKKEEVLVSHKENKLKTILVVEDSKEVLKLTSAMVKSLGYNVIESTSGDDAIKIIESDEKIDLLLTDVMLAGKINGPNLAGQAVMLRHDLKVLFNSGYAEHAIFQGGLLEEGVEFIGKPFRVTQLAEKLKKLLK